ncbi:hypothetical protein GR160_08360 [Flavobacterium sp. Sd200]|uniref:2'-5' RNA ligase family protein n=1 Tax=Flavobacterium sp. Sd200 TaxID=2692211 RepID=UPI00136E1B71|nr:2'-5' RNA ligase family protein [Flavobacterium sp. Sd200]MXN91240.1 hypothetical protein [Flavobacterium sp. Sd200]
MQHSLYFIAIIPPDDVCTEVDAFRNDFKNNYNSRAALKNVPHITLKAPFEAAPKQHSTILDWFGNLNIKTEPFSIDLQNFGAFDNPKNPVIYVKPLLTDNLTQLQKEIITAFELSFPDTTLHYHERHFAPHLTIAFRDLSYEQFKKAWTIYSNKHYTAQFAVNHLCLFKHNGTAWQVIAIYNLGS